MRRSVKGDYRLLWTKLAFKPTDVEKAETHSGIHGDVHLFGAGVAASYPPSCRSAHPLLFSSEPV